MILMVANRYTQIEQVLRKKGIRLTFQRQLILRRAVSHLHFTAEGLVRDVQGIDHTVSRGTVYRTLSLLHNTGLVEKHDFRYGPPNYEVMFGKAHHDHLMCMGCGEIIEFQEPKIEALQDEVVKRFGYQLVTHTHKLYGMCAKCQHLDPKRRSKPSSLRVTEIVK